MRRLILNVTEFIAIKVLRLSPQYVVKKYIRFIVDGKKEKIQRSKTRLRWGWK